MKKLKRQILNVEPIDLAETAERLREELPELAAAAETPYRSGKRTILRHTQESLDCLLDSPPAPLEARVGITAPWWWPMPATYAATLFHDLGRVRVPAADCDGPEDGHPRSSAEMARDIMFKLGIPFEVREHAVALILHHATAERYQVAGAADEKVLALSCMLDLGALCAMREANYARLRGKHVKERREIVAAFRRRCAALGVFQGPPPSPVGAAALIDLGVEDEAESFDLQNALRYFRIVHEMKDPDWFKARIHQFRAAGRRQLNILVGVAGCGKSTWAAKHLGDTDIIATDQLREELTGDPADQRMNEIVFERCMERITKTLEKGGTATFDATNYNARTRALPLKRARWHNARVVAYYFDVPRTTALARNKKRERQVPDETINRHYRALTVPALFECDELRVVFRDRTNQRYWPLRSHKDD